MAATIITIITPIRPKHLGGSDGVAQLIAQDVIDWNRYEA